MELLNFSSIKLKKKLLSIVLWVSYELLIFPLSPFLGSSLIIFITPARASFPYKLEEGPLTISICFIFPTEILSKSKLPADLPTKGWLSIKTKVYSESNPCIWIPSAPPKSDMVISPNSSLIISDNLVALVFSISSFFMTDAFSGSDDTTLRVLVPVIITSSSWFSIESVFELGVWPNENLMTKNIINKKNIFLDKSKIFGKYKMLYLKFYND